MFGRYCSRTAICNLNKKRLFRFLIFLQTIYYLLACSPGSQGIDDFHVGPFTVKDQTFGLIAEEIGDAFHTIPFEGILGMAFPSMS